MPALKIATWNVNGIRKRWDELTTFLGEETPDVVCLQEIKASPDQIAEALTGLPDYWSYWHGAVGGYSGVSLHLHKETFPEAPAFTHPSFDAETRIVQAKVDARGWGALTVASLYMPNGGKDYDAKIAFMKEMVKYTAAAQAAGERLIVCGDMNVARTDRDVHPSQRKPNLIGQRPEERTIFEAMIGHGLVDVGRALSPEDERMFTWWPYWREARTRNLGWRLDYVLATDVIAKTAQACRIYVDVGTSDHAPVIATFEAS